MAEKGNTPDQRTRRHRFIRRLVVGYKNIMLHGDTPSKVASWAIVIGLILIIANIGYTLSPLSSKHVDTSVIVQQISEHNIERMSVNTTDGSVDGTFKHTIDGVKRFNGVTPQSSDEFIKLYLQDTGIVYDLTKPSALVERILGMVSTIIPLVVVLGGVYYLMDSGGLSVAGDATKQKGKTFTPDMETVTFDDVCGIPEAVEEVSELVTFIRNRDAYDQAQAKTPRGVLLQGSPGSGKTMLAKALAGEAGVPFFATSGSDFVEMFVGVGASRIRSLFATARENQPCIIFIDEIDAIGGNRDAGEAGGYTEEHLQTMNQLLTEMDGFSTDDKIIVIAATNRGSKLDPALLRPGRFDRIITIDNPTKDGRKEILEHYAIGRPFAERVDFDRLTMHTYGFSGAQLESVMNQASTLAARRAIEANSSPSITTDDLDEAIARVISGPAMRSKSMTDTEKKQVAYHEAGHAIVQYMLPNCDKVQKISLVSRNIPSVGTAMGYVQTYSETDTYIYTADKCRDNIAALLAGRCAEELFCGIETTGASNDFEKASAIAYNMASEFAFNMHGHHLLRTTVRASNGMALSGTERMNELDYVAEDTMQEQYKRTRHILLDNKDKIERLVKVLLDKEQIDGSEIDAIINDESDEG